MGNNASTPGAKDLPHHSHRDARDEHGRERTRLRIPDIVRRDTRRERDNISEINRRALKRLEQRTKEIMYGLYPIGFMEINDLNSISYIKKGQYIPAVDVSGSHPASSPSANNERLRTHARDLYINVWENQPFDVEDFGQTAHRYTYAYTFYDIYGKTLQEDTQLDSHTRAKTMQELQIRKGIIGEELGIRDIPALLKQTPHSHTPERATYFINTYNRYTNQMDSRKKTDGTTEDGKHVISALQQLGEQIQKEQSVYRTTGFPMKAAYFKLPTWEEQLTKHVSDTSASSGCERMINRLAQSYEGMDANTCDTIISMLGRGGHKSTVERFKTITRREHLSEQARMLAIYGLKTMAHDTTHYTEAMSLSDIDKQQQYLKKYEEIRNSAVSTLFTIAKDSSEKTIRIAAIQSLGTLDRTVFLSTNSTVLSGLIEMEKREKRGSDVHTAIREAICQIASHISINSMEFTQTRRNAIKTLKAYADSGDLLENLHAIMSSESHNTDIYAIAHETACEINIDIAKNTTIDFDARRGAIQNLQKLLHGERIHSSSNDDEPVNDATAIKVLSALTSIMNKREEDSAINNIAKQTHNKICIRIAVNEKNSSSLRCEALERLHSPIGSAVEMEIKWMELRQDENIKAATRNVLARIASESNEESARMTTIPDDYDIQDRSRRYRQRRNRTN